MPPGAEPGPNQIVSSNNAGLGALIAEPVAYRSISASPATTKDDIRAVASRAADADMLVTPAARRSANTICQRALAPAGLDVDFWKIAMRPGKPLMFGRLGTLPMFGLPGNPVSAFVCATLFLRPAIARMQGGDSALHTTLARLGKPLAANGPREDYVRAALDHVPGELPVATPFERQDSSMLSVLARAGCLVIRPVGAPAAQAGESVTVLPLRS